MPLDRFDPFFHPNSIVIIGASRNEYTFNGVVLKNLLEAQYKGKIYIIHPYTETLMGIKCYPSVDVLREMNVVPELAIILTQKDILSTVESLCSLGVKRILIETDLGVNYTASERIETVNTLKKIAQEKSLIIMGPSMIGIIDFQHSFTTSVIPTRSHILSANKKDKPTQGVSFLAQSGGLTGACGWWAPPQNLPLAKIIHIGNSINVTEPEIFEYLMKDPATLVIILFLKDISNGYLEIMQKYRNKKPVLFKFVGKNSAEEQKFEEVGAISVQNYIELFEFAKVFLWVPPPTSNAVGIIGPSSGAINLLISEMRKQNIHLAQLNPENRQFILSNIGGSTCELGNPVDYWPPSEFIGTQICRVYHNASSTLLKDQNVGGLFLALEFFTEIEFNFSIFESIKLKYPNKPIICILIQAEKEGADRIIKYATEMKIPVFIDEIERAIRAYKAILSYYGVIS
jgi:acetyltransferase